MLLEIFTFAQEAFAAGEVVVGPDQNLHLTPSAFTMVIAALLSIVWFLSWKILNRIEKKQEEIILEFNKLKDDLPKTYIPRTEFEKVMDMTGKNCRERMEEMVNKINENRRGDR